ncbi:helix-turn-helix domain-containing protein [Rhodanobacter ginsengisoli]|uniref:Helix-turn-helix domain-containing protein n=1 Tax=Rhodanobacter ginsengisoli TaxID=418646 RepID=A0ABW0QLQ6_9GAMM
MTSIQPEAPTQGSNDADLFGINLPELDVTPTEPHGASFGSRLHAAREARGLDLEACANTLKLPARVLRQLERDQYDGIDSKVYLGSYISKYGRYLGIDQASLQVELDRLRQIEAPLVATGGISHSRFLLDRYATAATYVVLTLVIAVPTVWFGVRSTLDRDLSHLAPLDATPVAQSDSSASKVGENIDRQNDKVVPQESSKAAPAADQNQPLMASMAPFPSMGNDVVPPSKPVVSPATDNGAGNHALSLSLTAASWVEVTEADGTRLEYGLLSAGSNKTYHSDQPLDVRIGNVSGATVSIDGRPQGLDDFRHANVAHFRMQMQDGKASAASL